MERLRSSAKGILLILWLWCSLTWGQDAVMSQFTMSPTYLNPAYAGYSGDITASLQSRIQWEQTPGRFNTHSFSINGGCPKSRLGFGLQGVSQVEGEGFLRTYDVAGLISVNLPGRVQDFLGRRLFGRKYILSAGLRLGVGQKTLDWSELRFSDQYSHFEGFLSRPSAIQVQNPRETSNVIFDMSAGLRYQMELNDQGAYLSMGGALFHINRPVQTFFGVDEKVPYRYTLHLFTYFPTKKYSNKKEYLSIGLLANHMGGLKSNTLLLYRDAGPFIKVGVGFRRQNFVRINRNVDALIFQSLFQINQLTLGYSFDLTISDLGAHRTFGTHEFGITYTFPNSKLCGKGGRPGKLKCFQLNRGKDKNSIWDL